MTFLLQIQYPKTNLRVYHLGWKQALLPLKSLILLCKDSIFLLLSTFIKTAFKSFKYYYTILITLFKKGKVSPFYLFQISQYP